MIDDNEWPPTPSMARIDKMLVEFMLHGCVLSKVVSSMNAWVIHPTNATMPRLRYGKGNHTRGGRGWYLRVDEAGQRQNTSWCSMEWTQIPQTILIAIPPDTLKAFFEAL